MKTRKNVHYSQKIVQHPLGAPFFAPHPSAATPGVRSTIVPTSVIEPLETHPATRRLMATAAGYIEEFEQLTERPAGLPYTAIVVCTAGRGWLRLDGTLHAVEAPAVMVLPAWVPHAHKAHKPSWKLWWTLIGGTDVADLLTGLGASLDAPVVRIRNVDRAVALIDEILTSYESRRSRANMIEASGTAWRLMNFLTVDRVRPGPRDPVDLAVRYVTTHVDSHIDVTELAAHVGLSVSGLMARFRAATGGGVIAYQIQLRMARAAQLLDTSQRSVRDIGRDVGYDDPRYFSRRFQRTHGMSPQTYRLRARP